MIRIDKDFCKKKIFGTLGGDFAALNDDGTVTIISNIMGGSCLLNKHDLLMLLDALESEDNGENFK